MGKINSLTKAEAIDWPLKLVLKEKPIDLIAHRKFFMQFRQF